MLVYGEHVGVVETHLGVFAKDSHCLAAWTDIRVLVLVVVAITATVGVAEAAVDAAVADEGE